MSHGSGSDPRGHTPGPSVWNLRDPRSLSGHELTRGKAQVATSSCCHLEYTCPSVPCLIPELGAEAHSDPPQGTWGRSFVPYPPPTSYSLPVCVSGSTRGQRWLMVRNTQWGRCGAGGSDSSSTAYHLGPPQTALSFSLLPFFISAVGAITAPLSADDVCEESRRVPDTK